jgi:hypothetical protein
MRLIILTLAISVFLSFSSKAVDTVDKEFKRTGWNALVWQRFMHSPTFTFTTVEKAATYKCTLTWQDSANPRTAQVESKTPEINLENVWKDLSPTDINAVVEALDGEGKQISQLQFSFKKIASFGGPYRLAKCGYDESGAKAALWVLEKAKDEKEVAFPTLFRTAYIRILITYARLHPNTDAAAKAIEQAKKHGEFLIEGSMPADWAYANMPMSHHNKENLQICRTGMAGMAYLDLFTATADKKFLEAAIRIAETLKKTQLEDGRWYFRVQPQSGEMRENYTSDQAEAILFLDELIRNHEKKEFTDCRDKAVKWMLENPCKTFQWQQQWDDVAEMKPYENLEWFDAGLFIEYLLRYATPENGYEKIATSLFNYIEDQFVEWEPADVSITPGVREQYCCYSVIDWHTAHFIRVCMALYSKTKDEIYLMKAKAIADTLTVIQHPDGFYPTWMGHNPSKENPTELREINYGGIWVNCTSYAGEMMMKLEEYLKKEDIK